MPRIRIRAPAKRVKRACSARRAPLTSGAMRTIACLLALTLVLPAAAAAQRIPSPYRFIEQRQDLGVLASWVSTDRGTARLGPKSGAAAGLQYTLRISDPLAISARAVYFPTERDVIDTVRVDGALRTRVEDQAGLDLLLFTARFQFTLTGARTWHRIAPHVVAGIGYAFALSEETDAPTLDPGVRYEFGHHFTAHVGLGASVFLSSRWALRLALLDHLWTIAPPPGLRNLELDPLPPDREWTHNAELSAGLYRFF